MTRYKLIPPFPHGGEAWWLIADTESKHEPNFAVVQIFEWLPNAKDIATKICAGCGRCCTGAHLTSANSEILVSPT
jgi:hypothetical protein